MKNAKPLFFILFIVLIIWPVNYIIHALQRPDTHAEKLSQIVQSDEFLMGLNNKPGEGCVALKHLKDVDIIVIGSSHAYASIDPYVLKNALGNKRIALCAVPTWNTDFLHPFMKFLAKENAAPKRLVWIADAAVPLKIRQHDKRLDYAKAIFSDPATQKKISSKWIENIDAGLPVLGLSKENYAQGQKFHKDKTTSLLLTQVKQRLKTHGGGAEGTFRKILSTAKINPQNKENLRRLCIDIKLQGISLDLIMAPIPDKTSKLIAKYGPDTSYTDLHAFFEVNASCAQTIVSRPLYDWGLDERYFINRQFQDDYPYDVWRTKKGFDVFYSKLSRRAKLYFYSPDHMNPVGAAIFSKHVAEIISD